MRGVVCALILVACSEPSAREDAAPTSVDGGRDAGGIDGSELSDAPGAPDATVFDPGDEPTEVLRPKSGELTVIQLALPTGVAVAMGEAAIVVGPDGTIVLIDVGNGSHDDDVRAAITELNTLYLTPANGFAARSARQVEWIIATHFHGDHVGAFEQLLIDTDEPLEVTRGIVHRGFVDLGAGMNETDYASFCTAMRGPLESLDMPVCAADEPAPCVVNPSGQPHPATACPGLFLGDLAEPGDDEDGQPTFISLGAGARLTLVAADAHISNGTSAVPAAPFGHEDANEENARSLAGVISHGFFRYHFGGDMTGSGDAGEPDVESLFASVAAPAFYGDLGADVIHVHHHARRTSSNAAFVAAMAPADSASRNAIAGINAAYLGSPYQEVLDAWANAGRLAAGRFWATATTLGAGTHEALTNADGPLILQTLQAGVGYRVQAAGTQLRSAAFPSVRL